jgi:type II secretory pathway pseudopilin PulG
MIRTIRTDRRRETGEFLGGKRFAARGRKAGTGRSGFTTVELLVTMALLLIVGGLSVVTFQVASKTRRQAMARIDVAEKSRASLETLTRELGEALVTGAGRLPFPEERTWTGSYEAIDQPGDEDGDGLYNEEEISFIGVNRVRTNQYGPIGDNIDNDGPATMGAGVQIVEVGNISMRKKLNPDDQIAGIDEEYYNGIDDDGDGMIDEDCMFPADMLNFVIPATTSDFTYSRSTDPTVTDITQKPVYDLVEVGYSLNPRRISCGGGMSPRARAVPAACSLSMAGSCGREPERKPTKPISFWCRRFSPLTLSGWISAIISTIIRWTRLLTTPICSDSIPTQKRLCLKSSRAMATPKRSIPT